MYFISPCLPSAIHWGKTRNSAKSRTGAMPQRSNPASRAHCWMRVERSEAKWSGLAATWPMGWPDVLQQRLPPLRYPVRRGAPKKIRKRRQPQSRRTARILLRVRVDLDFASGLPLPPKALRPRNDRETVSHYHIVGKLGGGGMVWCMRRKTPARTSRRLKFIPRRWCTTQVARTLPARSSRASS